MLVVTKSYDDQRSHNGESRYSTDRIQIATKSMLGTSTTNGEYRKLIGVKTMSLFGYDVQFVLFRVFPVFQNLNYKLQRRLSDVLPNQQSHKVLHSDALASTMAPYQAFTTVCSYRVGVKRCYVSPFKSKFGLTSYRKYPPDL